MILSEAECRELLPWYLNKTLTAEERAAFEKNLQASPELQGALRDLEVLRDALPPQADFPAGDMGWRRLQKQIRAERGFFGQRQWIKVAAVAAIVMLTVQIGLFSMLAPDDAGEVRLLGASPVVVGAGEELVQLQLDPHASWQDVVTLVAALNGDVVQGPGASGVIRVRFALDRVQINGRPATSVDEVLQWLRAQPPVQHAQRE